MFRLCFALALAPLRVWLVALDAAVEAMDAPPREAPDYGQHRPGRHWPWKE